MQFWLERLLVLIKILRDFVLIVSEFLPIKRLELDTFF